MQTPSTGALLSLSLFLSLGLTACTAAEEDTTEADESEIRRRVDPNGNTQAGKFELVAPTWSLSGASLARMTFGGKPISVGGGVDVAPGSNAWTLDARDADDIVVAAQQTSVAITNGTTVRRTLAGVRVRYDQPLTFGMAKIELPPATLNPPGLWRKSPTGIVVTMLPTAGQWSSSAMSGRRPFGVAEGQLFEIVLPTTQLQVTVDTIDPAFPTPSTCELPKVTAGGKGATDWRQGRQQETGLALKPQVVPSGDLAPVVLETYGIKVSFPTANVPAITLVLNRLEVNDVRVDGTLVPGTFTVSRQNSNGAWEELKCSAPYKTHIGLDVPDGTYRVVSRAGGITHTETVSFP